jgi:hypothetical protein
VSGTSEVGCVYTWDASVEPASTSANLGRGPQDASPHNQDAPPHVLEALVAVGPDGLAVSASWDKTVKVWRGGSGGGGVGGAAGGAGVSGGVSAGMSGGMSVGMSAGMAMEGSCACVMTLPLARAGDDAGSSR